MTDVNAEEARGVSVLVVDDERALIEVMATALIPRSYDLRVAYDGRSALAAVEADPPDIVLLDLGLPDMDGLDVCREMRRWFANPIIILSTCIIQYIIVTINGYTHTVGLFVFYFSGVGKAFSPGIF